LDKSLNRAYGGHLVSVSEAKLLEVTNKHEVMRMSI
jgi:hypothetical protein